MTDKMETVIYDDDGNIVPPERIVWGSALIEGTLGGSLEKENS